MHEALVIVAFTLVGIGGFFMGYGYAAFLEWWTDR